MGTLVSGVLSLVRDLRPVMGVRSLTLWRPDTSDDTIRVETPIRTDPAMPTPDYIDSAEAFANEAENMVDTEPEHASAMALTSIAFSLLILAKRVDRQDNQSNAGLGPR